LNEEDLENPKVVFEQYTFTSFTKLEKPKRYSHMAMILQKVQKMNDDNSQRAMVLVRLSLQPSALGSKLWSYSKGKHLEVFFIIFDLANEKILFQQ